MIKRPSPLPITSPPPVPEFPNLALGGVAGVGKTHLIGTVGTGNKALIMDVEGGSTTFSSKSFKSAPDASDKIDVILFNDINTATELIGRVESVFDYIIKTKNSDGYKLVALDSLTELLARFLNLHQAADRRQSYGAFSEGLHSIITKARIAPVFTLFTARLRATTDEITGREIVRFDVNPGAWSVVSGLFDAILFMDMKRVGIGNTAKTVRVIDSTPNIRTPGKDRLDLGEMVDPTFNQIINRIHGGN